MPTSYVGPRGPDAGRAVRGRYQAVVAASTPSELGLLEIGADCYAYVQPGGGWGWSNAGLVVGDGVSLLVDTLFDLHLTARMLESMAPVVGAAPIGTLVNTHANGDHCFGNQLLAGTEIVASTAAAAEMAEVPPALLAALNARRRRAGGSVPLVLRGLRLRGHRAAACPPGPSTLASISTSVGGWSS